MAGPTVLLALLIGPDGSISVQSVSDEVPVQLGFTREDFLTSKASTPEIARMSEVNWAHHLSGLPTGCSMCACPNEGVAASASAKVNAMVRIATISAIPPDLRGPK